MALDPAVLRAMAAAGASIEVIIAAVEADLAAQNERKASRRANNAERQRRFKARNRAIVSDVDNAEVTHDNAGNALPSVTPSPSLSPQPPQTHPHPCNNNIPARKGTAPAKPEGVQDQTWRDFLAHRKAKRAPVTETALAGISREAEKAGWSLEAALAETVSRGWQAFKADWVGLAKPEQADSGYLDRLIAKAGASP